MSLKIALTRIESAQENKDNILDLSNLNLKEIPTEISKLTQLTHLYLEENQITSVNNLKSLRKLKILNLGRNKLKEIPPFLLNLGIPFHWEDILITSLANLKVILEFARSLVNIKDVTQVLRQNLAGDAGNLLEAKARAQDLVQLLSNKEELLISLDLIRASELTITLNAELNRELEKKRIIVLDVDLVLDMAKDIDREINLIIERTLSKAKIFSKTLDIDLARDLELEVDFIETTSLSKAIDLLIEIEEKSQESGIYLIDNPLIAPPPEIIKQGDLAVKTFFADFVEHESLNEVKVILVGEGASGKTSLVKRILNINFNQREPQTHGIKISKHEFNHQGQDFLVNFWDFGGQEILHATHQFFLTKRCLYLLVLDSRKDEKAEYWLNYIQSFGGNAPVIVVLNKTDENPSFDVNRKFLSKKYNNIQGYYKVSCLTDEGINTIRRDLMTFLWDLELRKTAFPKGWFRVKKYLESMTEDYISYSQYQSICETNHVRKTQSQKILLDLLNDLGVVLNYEELRWYDTQVLNPLWLTNAVYRIINSPILAKVNGKFNINDLDTIINDERYQKENPEHWTNIFKFWRPEQQFLQFPEKKFLFIVAMMKQFELLFQIDEYKYLIPGLLSEEENTYKFDSEDYTLAFVIEYMDFLPTSIIPRLMVKLNKYIHNNQVWKTGMVLEEKLLFNSQANIVLDKESKKIKIEITGERKRDFLTVIRETLKEINSAYRDLEVTEWIPLPELYKGDLLLVDYLELLGYEEGEQEKFYSGKLQKAFSVSDLLNGIEKPESRKGFNSCHVFVSYSHKDQKFKEKLLEHLMPLVRLNKATLWDNTSIDAGEEWDRAIFENLDKADIVLCLISSSFIASDFCYTDELSTALEPTNKELK